MSDTESPELPGRAGTLASSPHKCLVKVRGWEGDAKHLQIPLLETQFGRNHAILIYTIFYKNRREIMFGALLEVKFTHSHIRVSSVYL